MNRKLLLSLVTIIALGGGLAYYLVKDRPAHSSTTTGGHDEHGSEGHDEHAEKEGAKGPHGGRLLKDGDFAVELAIFELGVPPEFRAWFTLAGTPVAPTEVKVSVTLQRPGGVTDVYHFVAEGDFARGDAEVYEPHSFDYTIVAEHEGRTHRWSFPAPEMQTTISSDAARRAGLAIETAGPATMTETLGVYGQVKINANQTARATPRFGGVIIEARKAIGDSVVAGEVLAIVETNQSLTRIEVKAPITGVIVDRDGHAGVTVADGAGIYHIADLADVWIDLSIPKRDHARAQIGQAVIIEAEDGGLPARGTIAWISPTASAEAQALTARVVLPNSDHRWHAGLFVKASIILSETAVPVAVKESALQTLFDFTVVFSQHGEIYQARPLRLGRRSGGFIEVLKGLRAGEGYVTENSFLLKADIGKSGASHDH